MNTNSQEILINAFNALPRIVQESIKKADVPAKMKELASRHKIHIDKWAGLENEIILTLFGITDPADLIENIQKHVGLDRDEAVSINNDAVEIIFEPIRKKLQEEAESRASERGDIVVPIDQQKIMNELGEVAPKNASSEINSSKTVFQIIQERTNKTVTSQTPLPENKTDNSTTMRQRLTEDPYRELPV